jgi:hypothetical protein
MKRLGKVCGLAAVLWAVGCGSDADAPAGGTGAAGSGSGDAGSTGADAGAAGAGSTYVVGSLLFGDDDTTTSYVNLLDDLGEQTLDYDKAREFSGSSDLWVHEGKIFIADAETLAITKYEVDAGALAELGTVSLANYGLTQFGFYLNTFVAKDKAYFLNGAAEYIVWNPETMTIEGELEFPEEEPHGELKRFPAYSDRATQIRDGKLYQPLYWTDSTYFNFSEDTQILVIDIATDTVEDSISAPCPGLDYSTQDDAGTLYFSSWVYAAGGAQVLQQPDTCVFQVPKTGDPKVSFKFKDVADGHQGAAFRYLSNGKFLFSVLHEENAVKDATIYEVANGANWLFNIYDSKTHQLAEVDGIALNAGGQYTYDIDGQQLMLVPASDYSATAVWNISVPTAPAQIFETKGWATRLFKLD